MKPIILAALCAIAFATFAWSCSRLIYFLRKGRRETRPEFQGRWPERLLRVLGYSIGQKEVGEPPSYEAAARHVTSKHHLAIFWGFLFITIGSAELLLAGLVPSWNFSFLGDILYTTLKLIIDWFNFFVLLAVGYGFFRRIVLKPRLIP